MTKQQFEELKYLLQSIGIAVMAIVVASVITCGSSVVMTAHAVAGG